MEEFKYFHPLIILIYYAVAFTWLILLGHPVLVMMVLTINVMHYIIMAGFFKSLKVLLGSVVVFLMCMVINPLVNNRGVTVLFRLKDTNITAESVCYGIYMGLFLLTSLYLFSCFQKYMPAEKIMTLFAKRFPSFALLFSMILRFVPKGARDFKEYSFYHGKKPRVWSALVGVTLTDAMERSISMKQKGYGKKKRTSYHYRAFQVRDGIMGMILLFVLVLVICLYRSGFYYIQYFPSMKIPGISIRYGVLAVAFFGIPLFMRGKGEIKWLLSKRKIISSDIRDSRTRQ